MQKILKKLIPAIFLMVSVISSSAAIANFDAGLKAYNEKKYDLAYQEWIIAAKEGDYRANHWLGVLYQSGTGVDQDYTKAFKNYKIAADKDYALANHALGFLYARGIGVSVDPHKACSYWLLAALKGLSGAEYGVGMCYELGYGFDKNPDQAVKWYRAAAKQNFGDAASKVADLESQGYGKNVSADIPADDLSSALKETKTPEKAAAPSKTPAPAQKPAAKTKATASLTQTVPASKPAHTEETDETAMVKMAHAPEKKPTTPSLTITDESPVVIVHQKDGTKKIVRPASAPKSDKAAHAVTEMPSPAHKAAKKAAPHATDMVRVWLASVFHEEQVAPEWKRLKHLYRPYVTVDQAIIKTAEIKQGKVWRIYAGPMTTADADKLCVYVKGLNQKYTCIQQHLDHP